MAVEDRRSERRGWRWVERLGAFARIVDLLVILIHR